MQFTAKLLLIGAPLLSLWSMNALAALDCPAGSILVDSSTVFGTGEASGSLPTDTRLSTRDFAIDDAEFDLGSNAMSVFTSACQANLANMNDPAPFGYRVNGIRVRRQDIMECEVSPSAPLDGCHGFDQDPMLGDPLDSWDCRLSFSCQAICCAILVPIDPSPSPSAFVPDPPCLLEPNGCSSPTPSSSSTPGPTLTPTPYPSVSPSPS